LSTHVLRVYSSAAAQNYHDVGVTLGILLFWNKFARAHKNTPKLGKENTLLQCLSYERRIAVITTLV